MWRADGGLDCAALEAPAALGAPRLKMSIGAFGPDSPRALPLLKDLIGTGGIELLIENDQTAAAGTLATLRSLAAGGPTT
jgi:hypothetical protein